MKKHAIVKSLLLVVLIGCAVQAAYADGEGYIQLVDSPTLVAENGQVGWEYYYDVYSGGLGSASQIWMHFDATGLLNPLNQRWDSSAADGWGESNWGEFPSIGSDDGPDEWTLTGNVGAMINPIHLPSEYENVDNAFLYPGSITAEDDLHYWYGNIHMYATGLYMTIRLVHPLAPGDVSYSIIGPFYWEQQNAPLTGPATPYTHRVGDFDGDGDIDELDIDLLGDAIRTSSTGLALFDISADGATAGADGVIDIKDLDYLIRSLVETSLGTGTEYGDFNLDGVIDTTDLTRLATNYGADDWGWDDGNANRYIDTDIDNTDLTILATYYGFGEPDVVPEPATLSLLAVGAAGLLRRRRRA